VVWCFFAPDGKRFRLLGWSWLIVLAVFVILRGKSYYVVPVYPLLMAAGGVAIESFAAARSRRWLQTALPALLAFGGLAALPFGVPVLSLDAFLRYSRALPLTKLAQTERDSAAADLPQLYADMFGWDNIATTIAGVYRSLPPEERAGCAIAAGNYGEAGAIDYYGPALGLPKAISGHNSYFDWGPRGYSGSCVILFGERATELTALFGDVQRVATITTPHAMPSEREVPVYLCRNPRAPLAVLWPRFRMII